MKKLLLSGLLTGLAVSAFAQGRVALDNINNTSTSPTATSSGLFFFNTGAGPVLANTDFNAVFYAGTSATSMQPIASFIGAGATGDNALGGGTFLDPTGNSYAIAGAPSGTVFFQIQAWLGTATDYNSAVTKGQSPVFQQRISDSTVVPPPVAPDLVDMPAVTLSAIPEPSTFALAGLGAAALLIFRRRK